MWEERKDGSSFWMMDLDGAVGGGAPQEVYGSTVAGAPGAQEAPGTRAGSVFSRFR